MTHHWTDEQLEFAAVQTPPKNTVIVIVIATFPMFFSVGRKCSFGLRGEIYSTQKSQGTASHTTFITNHTCALQI